MRDTQLVLLTDGGAEVVDVDSDETIWASDSDEEFAEQFPEILDENDIEHVQDYLEEKGVVTSRELEVMEIMTEPLTDEDDEEDDDDEDDDEDDECIDDGDVDPWEDKDIVDGEVIKHE